MAVERTDVEDANIEESAEEREARLQQEREAELEEANQKRLDAEIRAAKAEGAAEEARRKREEPAPVAAAQWTEDQWAAEAEKHGMDVRALKLQVGMAQGAREEAKAAMKAEIEAAKEEARQAREEARRARAAGDLSKVEDKFYKDNPGLVARKGDVDEFMSLLPESVKFDAKAYADALAKAKVYATGKAREAVSTRRTGGAGGAPNTRRTQEPPPALDDGSETNDDLDLSDLENEGAASLVRHLHANPGGIDYSKAKPLSEMTRDEAHKQCERRDGRGVSIDESGEWIHGARKRNQELRDAGAK